jgi:hypothetical protein
VSTSAVLRSAPVRRRAGLISVLSTSRGTIFLD